MSGLGEQASRLCVGLPRYWPTPPLFKVGPEMRNDLVKLDWEDDRGIVLGWKLGWQGQRGSEALLRGLFVRSLRTASSSRPAAFYTAEQSMRDTQ